MKVYKGKTLPLKVGKIRDVNRKDECPKFVERR